MLCSWFPAEDLLTSASVLKNKDTSRLHAVVSFPSRTAPARAPVGPAWHAKKLLNSTERGRLTKQDAESRGMNCKLNPNVGHEIVCLEPPTTLFKIDIVPNIPK